MGKVKVYLSFDVAHDADAKTMLVEQTNQADSPFEIVDASTKDRMTVACKQNIHRRMENVDMVLVLCGVHTRRASGVNAEVAIAQEMGKPYFHLAAYPKACKRPKAAKASDKIYLWTWNNIKNLICGGR